MIHLRSKVYSFLMIPETSQAGYNCTSLFWSVAFPSSWGIQYLWYFVRLYFFVFVYHVYLIYINFWNNLMLVSGIGTDTWWHTSQEVATNSCQMVVNTVFFVLVFWYSITIKSLFDVIEACMFDFSWELNESYSFFCSQNHVNLVVVNNVPLFFNIRDGPYMPTLRLLHQCKSKWRVLTQVYQLKNPQLLRSISLWLVMFCRSINNEDI